MKKLYCFIFIIIFAFISCKGEKTAPKKVLRPVRYHRVEAETESRVRSFAGTAKAGEESKLSFKVPGTIKKLHVKLGDTVKKNDLIAELDSKDYELQVQQAEASLTKAQAEARNAAANYSRVRALYENNNASRNDLDASRAANESACAQVNALKKQLEIARLQLSYTRLKTFSDGAIAAVDIEENENIQAGKTVVLLTSGITPEVEIAIPEIFIANIKRGDSVQVTVDAFPGKTFSAQVTEVGVAVTGTATTFPVTVNLKKSDPDIRSGMAANVAFEFGNSDKKLHIMAPLHAVGEDRDGRFVFLLVPGESGKKGIVRRQRVKIGEMRSDGLEILEGVEAGDLIVTAGLKRVKDGMEVLVK